MDGAQVVVHACAMEPSLGPAAYRVYVKQWALSLFARKSLRRWFTRWVHFHRRGDIVHASIIAAIEQEEFQRVGEESEEESEEELEVNYDNVIDDVTDDGF